MIKLFTLGLKVFLLAAVVLVMSQIPLKGTKRICDVVGDMVKSEPVQKPIRWITGRFDFIEGHGVNRNKVTAAANASGRTGRESDPADPEQEDGDRATLSGLLKD